MLPLTPAQLAVAARAAGWFTPERPGPLVGAHVIRTGSGRALVDRWPDPRAVVVDAGGNLSLAGDPDALDAGELRAAVRGFLDVPEAFADLAGRAWPRAGRWPRRIFALPGRPNRVAARAGLRRLTGADARLLDTLGDETSWISVSWGGHDRLAASGTAWGAFEPGAGRLVSVACPFFVGERYEDLGVVTEPGWRGLGLSTACAGAVCEDVIGRGHIPSWTTSPDNTGSLKVAERLGFAFDRADELLAVKVSLPAPPAAPVRRPDAPPR